MTDEVEVRQVVAYLIRVFRLEEGYCGQLVQLTNKNSSTLDLEFFTIRLSWFVVEFYSYRHVSYLV